MTKDKANQLATVTLSDAPPVRVKNGLWPVVASASHDRDHNNQEIFRRHYLRVRQHDTGADLDALCPHSDGRCLVYGWYESSYQGESGSQAGYRCQIEDVVETIRKVGEYIGADRWLIDSCIADLPATTEESDGLPCEVSITIKVADGRQASSLVNSLIVLEQQLRAENQDRPGCSCADDVQRVRRNLQERSGLVAAPV